MKKILLLIALTGCFATAAFSSQLVTVDSAAGNLKVSLKNKEVITWMNIDKEKPLVVTFDGDMRESNFSTIRSRFYFFDGKTLTSNLISPGDIASISFENSGTYRYKIYGLDRVIDGEITVGIE